MNENIAANNRCSGCGVCYHICPTMAISFQENIKGFLRPIVDNLKCVNCGKCINFCHEHNIKNTNSIQQAYLASSKDNEILENSSSGGIFTELAYHFISNGGLVCGACLIDPSVGTVNHIIIDTIEDIEKLRKSKYVESSMVDILHICKDIVSAGKQLMFVGTPCQCAAVRNYLRDDKNLFVVDFICHGTGSPKVLKWYLSQEEKQLGKIETLDFRYKNNESGSYFYIEGRKSNKIIKNYTEGYPYAFASALIIGDDCTNCIYATATRGSDITLADKCDGTGLDFDKSTILVNTIKGVEIFKRLNINRSEVDLEAVLKNAWHLTKPNNLNPHRENFFQEYQIADYNIICEKYLVPKPLSLWNRIIKKLRAIVK